MAKEGPLREMLEERNCGAFTEEGQSGTYVKGKYKITQTYEMLHRHICCLISIVVITIFMVMLSVTLTVRKERPVSEVHVHSSCPPQWIGVGNKCFYFSDDTANWTFSQDICKSKQAGLVQIDTKDELSFLKRYKGPHDHWIGLSRESSSHPWKWTNNTEGNFVFNVTGTGEYAYLNDNGVSSGRIYSNRKWICSKPSSHGRSCQITSNS